MDQPSNFRHGASIAEFVGFVKYSGGCDWETPFPMTAHSDFSYAPHLGRLIGLNLNCVRPGVVLYFNAIGEKWQYRITCFLFLPDHSPAAWARTVVRAEQSEFCGIAIKAFAVSV